MGAYSTLAALAVLAILAPLMVYGIAILVDTMKYVNTMMHEVNKLAKNPAYAQNATEVLENMTKQSRKIFCETYEFYNKLHRLVSVFKVDVNGTILEEYAKYCNATGQG